MEYNLLLEQKNKKFNFFVMIFLYILFLAFNTYILGLRGFILSVGLLFFTALMPLLMGRYKFFLFLWIIVLPFCEFLPFLQVGSINILNFIVMGISFPYATLLIYKKTNEITKLMPFLMPLFIIIIAILFNLARPEVPYMSIFQHFKFHYFTLFVIYLTYFYVKNNSFHKLFEWMNIIAVINALTSIFQRVTGIGLKTIAGDLRASGITMHPNACGFLINITLIIQVYMFLKVKTKKEKILWGCSLFLNFLALTFTVSITSYLIFALNLGILFLYLPKKLKVISLFLLSFFLLSFLALDQVLHLGVLQTFQGRLAHNSSLDWRIWLWLLLLKNINFNTLLFGNGIDSISQFTATINYGRNMASHNGYLQMFYEFGIWGIIYLSSYFYVFVKFIQSLINKKDKIKNIENIIPLLIILVILIEMSVDEALINIVPIYYSWIAITGFYILQIEKNNKFVKKN